MSFTNKIFKAGDILSSTARKQNFLLGAMILMISNLAVKVIGAIFKIPLMNIIGAEGMAYFNAAYYIYVMFYQISTAGLPVAISRMVATANAKGSKEEVKKVFNISLVLFVVIGVFSTSVMMALSSRFAKTAELDAAVYCMLAIAPTVFFICVSSAYRGFFQGLQNMVPTAVSQVIEAVGKMAIGIICAIYFTKIGAEVHITAAWVISGVTIGVALSTFYIMIYKAMYNNAVRQETELLQTDPVSRSTASLLRELVIIAVPIAVSAAIMSLPNNIDTFLKPYLVNSGFNVDEATKIYGAYTGTSVSLFNMPPTLVYPFGISIIPVLSAAYAANDTSKAHKTSEAAFRIAAIISLPCAVGMAAMARQIISLVFFNTAHDEVAPGLTVADVGANTLSVMAIAIFAISLIAITNSILQAWHKEYMAIVATGAGVAVKLASAFIMLGIPGVAERSFAVSTALCYFTILFVNMFFVAKYTGYIPKLTRIFIKPFVSALACGITAILCDRIIIAAGIPSKLSTVLSIGVAGVVYLAAMGIMKGFYEEDILLMPKGAKIASLLKKIKVIR